MHNSPRFLNRFVLFVTGIVFLAVAAALVAVKFIPQVQEFWQQALEATLQFLQDTAQPFVFEMPFHWIWAAIGLVALIGIIIAVSIILSQGGGKTYTMNRFRTEAEELPGSAVLEPRFAEDLFKQRFENDPEILKISVSSYRVQRQNAAKFGVELRHGADLPEVVKRLRQAVADLEKATGIVTPTVIEIGSGLRTAIHSKQRVN